jgi:hypothetical protein
MQTTVDPVSDNHAEGILPVLAFFESSDEQQIARRPPTVRNDAVVCGNRGAAKRQNQTSPPAHRRWLRCASEARTPPKHVVGVGIPQVCQGGQRGGTKLKKPGGWCGWLASESLHELSDTVDVVGLHRASGFGECAPDRALLPDPSLPAHMAQAPPARNVVISEIVLRAGDHSVTAPERRFQPRMIGRSPMCSDGKGRYWLERFPNSAAYTAGAAPAKQISEVRSASR